MKYLFLTLSLLVFACSKPTKKKEELIIISPVQKTDLVKVLSTKGFTEKEKEKLEKYIPVMNETIDGDCFKNFILNRKVHSTNELTLEQVVEKLRTSKVEINLVTYYKNNRVAGYTYPSSNTIWLNRKFHKGASLCSEASNLAHELSHKLGFGHDFKATQRRPYSVPYSINAAFTACCK